MTRSPVAIALSSRSPAAPFTTPPQRDGWFDAAGLADAAADFVLCDDIASWPAAAVAIRLSRILRLLRPGGTLRVVTEDLAAAIHGYWLDRPESGADGFNAWMRRCAGRFIYDEAALSAALAQAGFVGIQRFVGPASAHEIFWSHKADDMRALALEANRPLP